MIIDHTKAGHSGILGPENVKIGKQNTIRGIKPPTKSGAMNHPAKNWLVYARARQLNRLVRPAHTTVN